MNNLLARETEKTAFRRTVYLEVNGTPDRCYTKFLTEIHSFAIYFVLMKTSNFVFFLTQYETRDNNFYFFPKHKCLSKNLKKRMIFIDSFFYFNRLTFYYSQFHNSFNIFLLIAY